MKKLYLFCLILYPFSSISYLLLCAFDANDFLLGAFFIAYIVSMLLSCFPSSLINIGYDLPKKTITADGILKLITLIYMLFFGYCLPKSVSLILLSILFLTNFSFMIIIYKHLRKDNIAVSHFTHKTKLVKASDDDKAITPLCVRIVACGSILIFINKNIPLSFAVLFVFAFLQTINLTKLNRIVLNKNVNKKRLLILNVMICMIFILIIILQFALNNTVFVILGSGFCYPLLMDSINHHKYGFNLKIYND